jgi:hypothetical protein
MGPLQGTSAEFTGGFSSRGQAWSLWKAGVEAGRVGPKEPRKSDSDVRMGREETRARRFITGAAI